jgi:hypothetical protein
VPEHLLLVRVGRQDLPVCNLARVLALPARLEVQGWVWLELVQWGLDDLAG